MKIKEGTQLKKLDPYERPAALDLTYMGQAGFPGHYLINRINVPKPNRGKGIASQMMQELCGEADKGEIYLMLEIQPSDGLGFDILEDWYRRLGFEYDPAIKLSYRMMMVRRPKIANQGGRQ